MSALSSLATLCEELDRKRVPYELDLVRPEAIMIKVAVPGERWELEIFDDGRIELERFVSQGVIDGINAISDLLRFFD
jgi:hypothetical protein